MQLKINGCRVNIHDAHGVTIDKEGCVCISLNYPHLAADDTARPLPRRRALKRNRPSTSRMLFTDDSLPPDEKHSKLRKGNDPFGTEDDDAERCEPDDRGSSPEPASGEVSLFKPDSRDEMRVRRPVGAADSPALIGTYRVVRGMLMLVNAEGRATWLYRPEETEASLDKMIRSGSARRMSDTASTDHVSDTDSDDEPLRRGVWAFSDYVVCDEDVRESKPSEDCPLCTHFVSTNASAEIVSIRALPSRYMDYVRSFTDSDVESPVEATASAVYDNALYRGHHGTIRRDDLLELIEKDTMLMPKLGQFRPLCTVCDLKNHPASYSFGPFMVGSVCAEYIKLAFQAHIANTATRQAIVEPDTFVKHWDSVTEALHGCAEVQSNGWKKTA